MQVQSSPAAPSATGRKLAFLLALTSLALCPTAATTTDGIALLQRWVQPQAGSSSAVVAPLTSAEDQNITLIGVETRGQQDVIPCYGTPGWNITNIGAGKKWKGWLGRVRMFRDKLRELSAVDPHQMVILVDVGDMMYGGCGKTRLLEYYNEVVQRSGGAEVVFSATLFLQPHRLIEEYKQLTPRMSAVLEAAGLPDDAYCSDKGLLKTIQSVGYFYLNAGFVMGPAGKVQAVFKGMLGLKDEVMRQNNGRFDDQMAANMHMLAHPDKVTLDYSGRLILTVDPTLMRCNRGDSGVKQEGDSLVNTVTGTTACFVHGNGGAWRDLARLPLWDQYSRRSSAAKWSDAHQG